MHQLKHANQIEVPQETKNLMKKKRVAQMNQNDEVTDYIDYSQGNLSDNVSNQETEVDDLDYIDFDEVVLDHVQEAIDPKLATERKESLTDKVKTIYAKSTCLKLMKLSLKPFQNYQKKLKWLKLYRVNHRFQKPVVEEVVEKS